MNRIVLLCALMLAQLAILMNTSQALVRNSWGCLIIYPNDSSRCLQCDDGYYLFHGGNSDACYLCNREPWN